MIGLRTNARGRRFDMANGDRYGHWLNDKRKVLVDIFTGLLLNVRGYGLMIPPSVGLSRHSGKFIC